MTPKLVYRALKLRRRGYKFANDNSFWRMIFIATGPLQTKRRTTKRDQRTNDLACRAFTVDTNVPSRPTDFGAKIIRSTGHPVTVIDNAFLFEQKDFRAFWERTDPVCRPFQTIWPFTKEDDRVKRNFLADDSVRILEKETIVYKICDLICRDAETSPLGECSSETSPLSEYEVCVALRIPACTRYIGGDNLAGYSAYRFELAYVHAVYAYPNVDISKILTCGLEDIFPDDPRLEDPTFSDCWHVEKTHPVQIKSPQYNKGFVYALNKMLHAELNDMAVPLDPGSQHGLYAYTDIDVAWLNYSHKKKLYVGDLGIVKKALADVKSRV